MERIHATGSSTTKSIQSSYFGTITGTILYVGQQRKRTRGRSLQNEFCGRGPVPTLFSFRRIQVELVRTILGYESLPNSWSIYNSMPPTDSSAGVSNLFVGWQPSSSQIIRCIATNLYQRKLRPDFSSAFFFFWR
jgi:hypothetical protein